MDKFYQSQIHNIEVDIDIAKNAIDKYQRQIKEWQEDIKHKEAYIKQLKQFKSDIENKLM